MGGAAAVLNVFRLLVPRFSSTFWRWMLGLCMAVVLVLSLVPASTPLPTTGWDKSNHLLGFAMLGLLGCFAFPGRVWAVLVGLLAYGALIEVLQSFTPDRFAEWADLFADGLGLLLGAALAWLWAWVRGPSAPAGAVHR